MRIKLTYRCFADSRLITCLLVLGAAERIRTSTLSDPGLSRARLPVPATTAQSYFRGERPSNILYKPIRALILQRTTKKYGLPFNCLAAALRKFNAAITSSIMLHRLSNWCTQRDSNPHHGLRRAGSCSIERQVRGVSGGTQTRIVGFVDQGPVRLNDRDKILGAPLGFQPR